ncbi:MAG: aldehyde dehydrogenase family protein [Methanomicrobiales archaeon]|nr:aldehyde dehydrogenase family protein [Methanomicrobiales archaeon]
MMMRIGGHEVPAGTDAWIPVINPATGGELDRVPAGGAEEVKAAVEAAGAAQEPWADRTPRERGKILFQVAGDVRRVHQDLARQLTAEQGKPLREAVDEIRGFANVLEYYASVAGSPSGEAVPLGSAGDALVVREPIGVCGAILPWNMPALIMAWKAGAALVTGNALVVKPASSAPLTCLRLAAVMEQAGLPPGVLNLVTGTGAAAGNALAVHPGVGKISFTGDMATGHRIRAAAASSLKEVVLELGGSDPMIVWEDAPLEKAVEGAVRGRFYNAGQICTAVKRLYLHQAIADRFLERLEKRVGEIRVGNGMDPATTMGPLQNRSQLERIVSFVDGIRAEQRGTVRCGGERMTGGDLAKGYFYAPTLVTDVDPDADILCEEVFGPVLPVMIVPDLETAITEANRTRYGLGASVWTSDLHVVKQVFGRVRAGIVWVNRHLTVPPEVPFGGMRESGLGRENGIQALSRWTRSRTLVMGW